MARAAAQGVKFSSWFWDRFGKAETEDKAEKMLGFIEDLWAICGSRSYIFIIDAPIVSRLTLEGSLRTFLEEEDEMGSDTVRRSPCPPCPSNPRWRGGRQARMEAAAALPRIPASRLPRCLLFPDCERARVCGVRVRAGVKLFF